jgi:hypothetical protein
MSDQEALVEELAAQASRDLQAGREAARRRREKTPKTPSKSIRQARDRQRRKRPKQ